MPEIPVSTEEIVSELQKQEKEKKSSPGGKFRPLDQYENEPLVIGLTAIDTDFHTSKFAHAICANLEFYGILYSHPGVLLIVTGAHYGYLKIKKAGWLPRQQQTKKSSTS